jgi:lipoate-protein ligase A
MFCIILDSHDPFFNLAVEEMLLKNRKEEYCILGINQPAVIIGKHQSAHREVDTEFITENNIPVIRRISGGGAVFHDNGNLNFTFIRQCEPGKQIDFEKNTRPVIDFLMSLGVEAGLEGKNDLKVNGLKISGNAEHVYRNKVLHHGTLLFSASLDMLRSSLRKDASCYSSRAVKSIQSSVTNLKERLPMFRDISDFRSDMMNFFLQNLPEAETYELSEQDRNEAEALTGSKYRTWEWNWAYGPEYQFINKFESGGLQVFCRLFVKDGTIRECIIEGMPELATAGMKLIGCRHMVMDMLRIFEKENVFIDDKQIFNFF